MEKLAHRAMSPFGAQPITAAHLHHAMDATTKSTIASIDKWSLFRDLTTARAAFGLCDRTLTVLNALLSFHKPTDLVDTGAPIIVFPSNSTLAARAHGMAESTLRRHLANLVQSGMIARHDSPNGKRYRTRETAFGFDLRPLLLRAPAIAEAAAQAQATAQALREARGQLTLILRDAAKLCAYGLDAGLSGDWQMHQDALADLYRHKRRVLDLSAVEGLIARAIALLDEIEAEFGIVTKTKEISGNDSQNERHNQNSNPDSTDFEPALEKARRSAGSEQKMPDADVDLVKTHNEGHIPLSLVMRACPDIRPYAGGKVDSCQQLIHAAHTVRSMMGISPDAWQHAIDVMGQYEASVVLAAILQRFENINSPGGYLRALTEKAAAGKFSPMPMIMALINC